MSVLTRVSVTQSISSAVLLICIWDEGISQLCVRGHALGVHWAGGKLACEAEAGLLEPRKGGLGGGGSGKGALVTVQSGILHTVMTHHLGHKVA